jgi:hypothetical protein
MPPSRCLGGAALPLLLSLAAHAVVVLALYAWSGGREEGGAIPGIGVDTVTLKFEDGTPHGTTADPYPPPGGAEAEFAVSVSDPDPSPAPPMLPSAMPVISPAPAGSSEPRPLGSGEVTPLPNGRGSAITGGRESRDGTSQGRGLFPVGRHVRTVVFVLDRSLSMWEHGTWDLARAELLASLRRLPATTRFQVIPYNLQAEPLRVNQSSDLLTADPATLRQVAGLVLALRASGNTNHGRALCRGLQFRPDVLYFITDADEIGPDVVTEVTRLNRGGTVIHAVELSERRTDRPDSPLRRLATRNGGTYRQVAPRE